jgi:hypothetical protein
MNIIPVAKKFFKTTPFIPYIIDVIKINNLELTRLVFSKKRCIEMVDITNTENMIIL